MKTFIHIALLLLIQFIYSQTPQRFKDNRMLSITIDGSRLIEDSSEFDSGLDLVGTLIVNRSALIQPLLKFEVFPNINFYKFAVGGNYTIRLNNKYYYQQFYTELSLGFEVGEIIRKNQGYGSYSGWLTYGFNAEVRLFEPFNNIPLIASYNYQRRTDFQIYGCDPAFIGSLYIGIGVVF